MYVILNGNQIPFEEVRLSQGWLGFNYAEGFFETMLARNGICENLQEHINRLQEGGSKFGMNLPFSREDIETQILWLIKQASLEQGLSKIKLYLFASGGLKTSPLESKPQFMVSAQPLESRNEKPITSILIASYRLSQHPLSAYKTFNRQAYRFAEMEAKKACKEVALLLDDKGNLSEFHNGNMLWKKEKAYFTPSLSTGCIKGITLEKKLKSLRKQGHQVYHINTKLQDLEDLEECYLINALSCRKVILANGKLPIVDQ